MANQAHPGADYAVTRHADGVIELRDRNWLGNPSNKDVLCAALESCRQRAWAVCTARAARDVLPRSVPWDCIALTWEWLKGPSRPQTDYVTGGLLAYTPIVDKFQHMLGIMEKG